MGRPGGEFSGGWQDESGEISSFLEYLVHLSLLLSVIAVLGTETGYFPVKQGLVHLLLYGSGSEAKHLYKNLQD